MHTENVNFLCANNQTLHGVSAIKGTFWTIWGPNGPLWGLGLGLKTSMSSTHVYLQFLFLFPNLTLSVGR